MPVSFGGIRVSFSFGERETNGSRGIYVTDDGVDVLGDESVAAEGVAAGCELPVAVCGVDGDVGDAAGVLAGVDVTEGVCAGPALSEVGGEEGG